MTSEEVKGLLFHEVNETGDRLVFQQCLIERPPQKRVVSFRLGSDNQDNYRYLYFPYTYFQIIYCHNEATNRFRFYSLYVYFSDKPVRYSTDTLHTLPLLGNIDAKGGCCLGDDFNRSFYSEQKLVEEIINLFFTTSFTDDYDYVDHEQINLLERLTKENRLEEIHKMMKYIAPIGEIHHLSGNMAFPLRYDLQP